jgi:PRC-barrel domain
MLDRAAIVGLFHRAASNAGRRCLKRIVIIVFASGLAFELGSAVPLPSFAANAGAPIGLAQGKDMPDMPHPVAPPAAGTPEQRMNQRFPQPVRVGDLISLRVLDDEDVTLGYVRQVVRTPEGKILLIVAYGTWFGRGGRLVAVPIEAVAILGRQIAALDMPPSAFAAAPTWPGTGAQPIPDDEMIRIGLTRR